MSSERPAGALPARIGRYQVLERLGKGAMGVVYGARDEVMDRVVAVKVLMADLEAEPDTRTRFYREAQAAGRLLHPNIITIFDIGEDQGRIYIVMELLKGQTLAAFLRQPVSLEQKIDLMVQTCEGLAAAHASGVVHRDVKPGNLFVLHDGTLKILDFGVARLATSTITASGLIIGTPDYMSPEQARGAEIDPRSDVFSAAAVFYHILSGRKPFAGRDLPAVLRKVQSEPPPPLADPETPAPLADIVLRALAKDPAQRHQSMTELAADLSRFKRHYEAETRRAAAATRDRYDAVVALATERRQLEGRLGLPSSPDPEAAARLRMEHPSFVERAPALLLVPFTRSQLAAIDLSLSLEHDSLLGEVEPLRAAATARDEAERELAAARAGDPGEEASDTSGGRDDETVDLAALCGSEGGPVGCPRERRRLRGIGGWLMARLTAVGRRR